MKLRIRGGPKLCTLAVLGVLFLTVALAIDLFAFGSSTENLPALYLTIVVHNEEDTSRGTVPKANIPDYDGNEEIMNHFAFIMRTFAQMAQDHGAKINFGSDWTFSRGVALYEPTFYGDLEAMGHEIDAHAHESSVLYHEVRKEIVLADGHPTAVASGMDETTIQEQLGYFDYYPEFHILWGVALLRTWRKGLMLAGSTSKTGRVCWSEVLPVAL